MPDPFDLRRFADAQAPMFAAALAELQAGRKRSHWMWFIFPQLRGLGISAMAHRFGIASLAEASAYFAHPLLGARLEACTHAVLASDAPSLLAIFGSPDDRKFISSMTLFEAVAAGDAIFGAAIDRWGGGRRDQRTLELLADG